MMMSEGEPQYLYLTTTGWKTGKRHEIEIWFVSYQNHYYLCSEKQGQSHWVQNIQHNPIVSFRIGEETFNGSGRVISLTESELLNAVKHLFDTKYNWSAGLMIELTAE
jgi:deazaflavin-dependent oxidoreductase (nitroreductase family)